MNKIESQIRTILSGNGTTFATLDYQTIIPTSAKHKGTEIKKITSLGVICFQTIKDYELYSKAVIKSALANDKNQDIEAIQNFEQSEASFDHDENCFSIVANKNDPSKKYLYWIANEKGKKSEPTWFINGEQVEKETIRDYLTPSKAKEIFEPQKEVYNVKNGIWHSIKPRTLKLENILGLKANKQTI